MPKRFEFPSDIPEHIFIHLTEREQMAVTRYTELNMTQAAVGKVMGISQQRVKQLLSNALAKINGTYIPVSKQLDLDDVSNLDPSEFAAKM